MAISKPLVVTASVFWLGTLGAAYWAGQLNSSEELSGVETQSLKEQSLKERSDLSKPGAEKKAVVLEPVSAVASLEGGQSPNPLRAFDLLLQSGTNQLSSLEGALLVQRLSSDELPHALALIQNMSEGKLKNNLLLGLMERWGRLDPNMALEQASSITASGLKRNAISRVLKGWGATNPSEAISWLNENAADFSSRDYRSNFTKVMAGYASQDPYAAFQYATSLNDGRLKNNGVGEVLKALQAEGRVGDARGLIEGMPEGGAKQSAMNQFVAQWASYDPEAASRYVEAYNGQNGYKRMQRELIESWANYDPESAADWLSGISPESDDNYGALVTDLVSRWSRHDMEASAEWLNSVEPSPEIDRAVVVFAFHASQEDPEMAMSWAESISDEKMRNKMTKQVASSWKRNDIESFNTYLANSEHLSEEAKDTLRKAPVWRGGRGRGGR